jgi:hypothetical protein
VRIRQQPPRQTVGLALQTRREKWVAVGTRVDRTPPPQSGRTVGRSGLRMMADGAFPMQQRQSELLFFL